MRLALEAMEKLASGHANLRQMFDALPVPVGIVGRGTLLYANLEMEEFFALHGEEPALAPFTPMQNASFVTDQEFLQKIDNRHIQLFKPDGTMRDYMLSCFPTEFDGTAALMGWLVDVTWLTSVKQPLVQAGNAAPEVVDSERHLLRWFDRDISEALSGMLAVLQQAMQTSDAEQRHQAVNTAYTFGKRLHDTLEYMLNTPEETPADHDPQITRFEAADFFSLDHEPQITRFEAVDFFSPDHAPQITRFGVADFFCETLHSFAEQAATKGITFDSRLDPQLPEELAGDLGLLRLIITHLVGNAVQYTAVGGVTVHVAPLPSGNADKSVLHIMIADTGLGISDTQMHDLSRSIAPEHAGSGLAVVRGHVRLLEGELCITSEPGQGTEAHLVLPFALHLPEESLFSEAAEESLPFLPHDPDFTSAQNQDAVKGRILVVDDIPTNMQIMVLILQKMGYEAVGADSGAQALSLLEEDDFDLVFLDILMPHMDGMEVTARIRNDDGGRYPRDIPIVAMTAHAMPGQPEEYLAAGITDYLSKPVIVEDIANILNTILKR
jgi:CheY-like chemotaxis protein/signal transduction histidine kinase